MAGDGKVHSLNVADGDDVAPPFQFGYPNGKSYALNLWDNHLFTTTSQGCAGNPNQIWAVNLKDPETKVMNYNLAVAACGDALAPPLTPRELLGRPPATASTIPSRRSMAMA